MAHDMRSDLWRVGEGRRATLKPRKRTVDTEMDITPMIDITFLLLIFFLVASRMNVATNVELPPARFGAAVATRNSVIITIDKGSAGGPAAVYRGDGVNPQTELDSSDPEMLEAELEDYVEASMLSEVQKRFVLIKAAATVRHRDVARVAQAVSQIAAVQQLHVAVLEEGE